MGKDTFIIYASFYKPISILSDKQLGRLFRAIFKYNLGEAVDVEDDIRMAFEFFKNQFDIDESKYQAKIMKNIEGGRKGGNPNFKKGNPNPYYKKDITEDNQTLSKITKDNLTLYEITEDKPINVNDNDNDNKEKDNSNELSKKKSGDQCSDKAQLPVDTPPAAEEKEKSSAKKEKEKIKFAEYVTMTNAEHQALTVKFGEQQVREMIEILDNYKGANGKRYKSDYRAILSWVAGEYAKRKQERERNNGNRNLPPGMIYRNPRQEEEILKKYGI